MLKILRINECRQLRTSQCWRSKHRTCQEQGNEQNPDSSQYRWQQPCGEHTGINVYNHNVRRKVPLVLRNPQMVTWYTCGPTVYDKTHIGHASTYVKVDIIQRILRDYFKFNLVTAMNITDVDDKIIKRSKENGQNWLELARTYDEQFKRDMTLLNVQPPNLRAHVSANIPGIQSFIGQLLEKKKAYITDDKSVYFDVSSCRTYGKLENISKSEQAETPLETGKRNVADFALWKAKKEPNEPSWRTSWGGDGRPGWHIECSVIASMFFGQKLDFHAGGLDLRFPHHENEEAQCCENFGTDQWVNYWLHTGQLHLVGDQQKMSKSLGNTVSVTDLLQHYTADEFRMACLLSNYRNAMLYSDELMLTARHTLHKFKNFHADLCAYMQFQKPLKFLDQVALQAQLKHMTKEFDNSLRDDFDTARAISILMDQMSSISRCINDQQADAQEDPAYCLDLLLAAGNFINVSMQNFGITSISKKPIDKAADDGNQQQLNLTQLLDDVLILRNQLRQQAVTSTPKNKELLVVCDKLRNLIERQGFSVRDHERGSSLVNNEQKSLAKRAKSS